MTNLRKRFQVERCPGCGEPFYQCLNKPAMCPPLSTESNDSVEVNLKFGDPMREPGDPPSSDDLKGSGISAYPNPLEDTSRWTVMGDHPEWYWQPIGYPAPVFPIR